MTCSVCGRFWADHSACPVCEPHAYDDLPVMTESEWMAAPDDAPIAAIVTDAEAIVARIQDAQSEFWDTVARLNQEYARTCISCGKVSDHCRADHLGDVRCPSCRFHPVSQHNVETHGIF